MRRGTYGKGCVYARRKPGGALAGYWIKFYRDGEQIVRNAHTTDKAEAERQLDVLMGEKASGVNHPRRQLTLGEAVDNVRTANKADGRDPRRKKDGYDLHVLPFFG